MQITTLPVYSKLADAADIPEALRERLPDGLQLSQHQAATYAALCNDAYDVVINTAMTGDGKSLAGLLPLLVDPQHNGTLALYPTNELIQDQQRSAEQLLPRWQRPTTWPTMLYGARLDELVAEVAELKRPEVLLRELDNHPLVLSNPDMLHAILQFHYQQYGRAPTHVAGQIAPLFEQLTFDEFHIFETPQVVAVLTGLLFLLTQNRALKTLLLSATPSLEVTRLFERAGFGGRMCTIAPQHEGWYHHGADPGAGWRPILQGSQITFAQGNAEEWIAVGGDRLMVSWFRQQRPGAKAALIVNSVASALRLTARLKPIFAGEGLKVEPNTGITGRSTRKASYDADLLIGTSTVDVGVDFRINLLVFEAGSAGTFLQRLGRLGRHTSYTDRDGREHAFADFAAYALVPAFIYERLSSADGGQPARLRDGETYTREYLADAIKAVFPQPAGFQHYTRLWGRFLPAKVMKALTAKPIKTTFEAVSAELLPRYSALVQGRIGDALRDWKAYREDQSELLVHEAQSFRGGSPFDCGVLKPDDAGATIEVVTYELFWLLSNARLELLSREAFCAVVRAIGQNDAPYKRGFQKYFFRWRGLRERREPITIVLSSAVARWGAERHQVAQILPGIEVDCADHDCLTQLNRQLRAEPCAGLLIPGHDPLQVQRARYLPYGLQLWPYRADQSDAGEQRGTIAFGRDALLLDSMLRTKPLGGAPNAPLIF